MNLLLAMSACIQETGLAAGDDKAQRGDTGEEVDPSTFDGDCGDWSFLDRPGVNWQNSESSPDVEDIVYEVSGPTEALGFQVLAVSVTVSPDTQNGRGFLACDHGDVFALGGDTTYGPAECPWATITSSLTDQPERVYSSSGYAAGTWTSEWQSLWTVRSIEDCDVASYEEEMTSGGWARYTVVGPDSIDFDPPEVGASAVRIHLDLDPSAEEFPYDLWYAEGTPWLAGGLNVGVSYAYGEFVRTAWHDAAE